LAVVLVCGAWAVCCPHGVGAVRLLLAGWLLLVCCNRGPVMLRTDYVYPSTVCLHEGPVRCVWLTCSFVLVVGDTQCMPIRETTAFVTE